MRYFKLKGKILDIKIWNISRIIDLVDIASSCSVRQNVSKNRRIKENGRSCARNKGVFVQFRIKQNSYSSGDRYISYRELTLSNVPRNKTSGYSVYKINKSWDIKYRKRFRIFRGKFKYLFQKVIFFNDVIAVLIPQLNWPLSWVWTPYIYPISHLRRQMDVLNAARHLTNHFLPWTVKTIFLQPLSNNSFSAYKCVLLHLLLYL